MNAGRNNDLVKSWFENGEKYANSGQFEKAISAYDAAIELDQQFSAAWNKKGIALHNLGRFEEAGLAFDKALELDPKCWHKEKQLEILDYYIIKSCNNAIAINPNDASSWWLEGKHLNYLSRYEEAIEACQTSLNIDPQAEAWYHKGKAFFGLGKYEQAIKDFEKAIEINPQNVALWKV
jgi:tetratricopeptide (TPR) repeat protein